MAEATGEKFQIFVNKIPPCKQCPFNVQDVSMPSLGKNVNYCFLKSKLNSAQYGGIDIVDPTYQKCPLTPIKKSTTLIKLNERVRKIESILGLPQGILED